MTNKSEKKIFKKSININKPVDPGWIRKFFYICNITVYMFFVISLFFKKKLTFLQDLAYKDQNKKFFRKN